MVQFKQYDHVLLTYSEGGESELRAFYGEILGLKEIPGLHPGGSLWFSVAGKEIHFATETAGGLSRRHVAFEIANLKETRDFLEDRGIEVSYSTKIEGRDRFFVRDPFGNRIEFLEYH